MTRLIVKTFSYFVIFRAVEWLFNYPTKSPLDPGSIGIFTDTDKTSLKVQSNILKNSQFGFPEKKLRDSLLYPVLMRLIGDDQATTIAVLQLS